MEKPKNLVFDLDDTLLDTTRTVIPEANRLACLALIENSKVSENLLKKLKKERNELLVEHSGDRASELLVKKLQKEGSGLFENPSELISKMKKSIESITLKDSCLFEDAIPLLNYLSEKKVNCILLSAGAEWLQKIKIEKFQLKKYFQKISIVENGESHLIKLESLKRLIPQGDFSNTWVIGDRLDLELRAAAELGMKPFWIQRGRWALNHSGNVDFQIEKTYSHLSELHEALRRIL